VKIIIKTAWSLLATSLIITGLVACSSTPAPWSRANDSPWSGKRAAAANNPPPEEITATTINEPVPLKAQDDWGYPPPRESAMAAPEPVQVAAIAAPEPEPMQINLSPEEEVMALPPTAYAVQIYAGVTKDSVSGFQEKHGLIDMKAVRTDRGGKILYVLVSLQADRASAKAEATDLESRTGAKPWVRSIPGLQKIVAKN